MLQRFSKEVLEDIDGAEAQGIVDDILEWERGIQEHDIQGWKESLIESKKWI